MKILTHEKSIKRNAKIGQYTLYVGLALLAGALFFNISGLSNPKNLQEWQIWLMYGGVLGGFIVMQISTYFSNRFGRHPRIDERVTAALKGLTKDYTLYHYLTPVSHLLVGPAGVWIIEPYYQRGIIVYEKNRWKQKGGGFMLNYLKLFGQEGLGRPDLEVKSDLDSLGSAFKKIFGDEAPPLNAALVFFDPKVELQVEGAPLPTLKLDLLKEYLRKTAKENPFPAAQIKRVTEVLPQESVE
jgi:hypothetical protein